MTAYGGEGLKLSVSLTCMVFSDTPKAAGRKGGKPAKKYGQSGATRVFVQNYSNPFDDCPLPLPSSPFDKSEFSEMVSRRISVCQVQCGRPMRDDQGRVYPPLLLFVPCQK